MRLQCVMTASGIAVAKTRTLSPRARVAMKIAAAVRRAAGPKRRSRRSYAVSCVPSKYPGRSRAATPIRPIKYPNDSCRKVRSPRAARPGTEMIVSADVSVATIDSMIAHQGSPRRPRK